MTRQTKNPMHSRCGLEDCDCGYVIEKLIALVEQAMLDYERCSDNSECWYSAAGKAVAEVSHEGAE